MPGRSQRDRRALQHKALSLLDDGATIPEAAAALGVSGRTLRRWRQRAHEPLPEIPKPRAEIPPAQALVQMLRAEGCAVARVLLDLAKGGDVRAAALIVRLLGNTLTSEEESDDADPDAALSDIERELRALPSTIASEIVGLLAQAQSAPAAGAGGPHAEPSGRQREPSRLPWQEEDHPSHEGDDPL